MNKTQAIEAHMNCISLSCTRRTVEQAVVNDQWISEETCEWFVDYQFSKNHKDVWTDHIYWHVDAMSIDYYNEKYDGRPSVDILGGYWTMNASTNLTAGEADFWHCKADADFYASRRRR